MGYRLDIVKFGVIAGLVKIVLFNAKRTTQEPAWLQVKCKAK